MRDLKEKVITAIKEVYDPELPVNIYELGLIYDIAIDEDELLVEVVHGSWITHHVACNTK